MVSRRGLLKAAVGMVAGAMVVGAVAERVAAEPPTATVTAHAMGGFVKGETGYITEVVSAPTEYFASDALQPLPALVSFGHRSVHGVDRGEWEKWCETFADQTRMSVTTKNYFNERYREWAKSIAEQALPTDPYSITFEDHDDGSFTLNVVNR